MLACRTPNSSIQQLCIDWSGDSLIQSAPSAHRKIRLANAQESVWNAGAIRALVSPIRGARSFPYGLHPILKHFQTAGKKCSQGWCFRGGARLVVLSPIWIRSWKLIGAKKQPRRWRERVRHLDYGVQFNRLMYQRLIKGGHITLFSPSMYLVYTTRFRRPEDLIAYTTIMSKTAIDSQANHQATWVVHMFALSVPVPADFTYECGFTAILTAHSIQK